MFSIASALSILSLLASPVLGAWNTDNNTFAPSTGQTNPNSTYVVSDDLYNRLLLNRGYLDRLNTLRNQNNSDIFKFNFSPAVAKTGYASRGAGGVAVLANRGNFPALIGTGVSMAMGFLEPCGLNTPHYHPFATQLVTVVQGGPLTFGAHWDNSAPTEQLTGKVYTYEMVALPQGSIHWVFNDNCSPIVTVNAFTSDDPGILNVAPTFFKMNAGVINGTLDYPSNLDGYSPGNFINHIPPSYAYGAAACLQRCNISQSVIGTPPS